MTTEKTNERLEEIIEFPFEGGITELDIRSTDQIPQEGYLTRNLSTVYI